MFFQNYLEKFYLKLSFNSVNRTVPKKRKVASYRRNNKISVLKNGLKRIKAFFIRTSIRFYSALAILEPQI